MTTVAAPRHRVQPPQTLTELVEDTEWLALRRRENTNPDRPEHDPRAA